MTDAIICASCPVPQQAEVAQMCRARKIMKAFSGAVHGLTAQWKSQVLMATVGLIEERDARRARIICLEGGGVLEDTQTKESLAQAIRAEIGIADFPVIVEWMSVAAFRHEFDDRVSAASSVSAASLIAKVPAPVGAIGGNYCQDAKFAGYRGAVKGDSYPNKGSPSGFGKGAKSNQNYMTAQPLQPTDGYQKGGKRGAPPVSMRNRSPKPPQKPPQDNLVVVWVCGECGIHFETHELLSEHQQSESHWSATLADCGRRFISKEEKASLGVVSSAATTGLLGDAVEVGVPIFASNSIDPPSTGCEVYSLAECIPLDTPTNRAQEAASPAASSSRLPANPSVQGEHASNVNREAPGTLQQASTPSRPYIGEPVKKNQQTWRRSPEPRRRSPEPTQLKGQTQKGSGSSAWRRGQRSPTRGGKGELPIGSPARSSVKGGNAHQQPPADTWRTHATASRWADLS